MTEAELVQKTCVPCRGGNPGSITFGWGFAGVVLQTKKIKGLYENDFIVAAKISGIADQVAS